MIPGEELFRLVKSLTANEKRYFKLFASLQGTSDIKTYMQFFNALDEYGSEKYDEKKLQLSPKQKNLPRLKIYLYNLILKSSRVAKWNFTIRLSQNRA